jgi:hypothetical protein
MTNVFPILIIGLSFWAALVYFVGKQPLHGTYWTAAGILNTVVLFMGDV